MKKTLCLILALLTVALATLPLFCAVADTRMYVKTGNGKSLNVRSEPKMGDNIIATIKYRTAVNVIKRSGKWSLIELATGSDPAWVVSSYLVSKDPGPYKKKQNVTKTNAENFSSFKLLGNNTYDVIVNPSKTGGFVNLRWTASKAGAVVKKLAADTELTVLAEGKYWLQVMDNESGFVGFVDKKLVK